mmetsp:Transcript_31041/g.93111  ORF Transcript_31041/g.93111 Transcript_31041/m.93111 type:complete len:262 (+) Transcript_31041:950-1735(+)
MPVLHFLLGSPGRQPLRPEHILELLLFHFVVHSLGTLRSPWMRRGGRRRGGNGSRDRDDWVFHRNIGRWCSLSSVQGQRIFALLLLAGVRIVVVIITIITSAYVLKVAVVAVVAIRGSGVFRGSASAPTRPFPFHPITVCFRGRSVLRPAALPLGHITLLRPIPGTTRRHQDLLPLLQLAQPDQPRPQIPPHVGILPNGLLQPRIGKDELFVISPSESPSETAMTTDAPHLFPARGASCLPLHPGRSRLEAAADALGAEGV